MIKSKSNWDKLKRFQSECLIDQSITNDAVAKIQEEEKAAIGKKLSEEVIQVLSAGLICIDIAGRLESSQKQEILNKSQSYLQQAIREITILSKRMTAPTLNDLGLKEAIYEIIREANTKAKATNFRLGIYEIKDQKIQDFQSLIIYRIIQELFENIIKHANATEALLQITVVRKTIKIVVCDNGTGICRALINKGLGLRIILSRLQLYNGSMNIFSGDGNGTMVRLDIPIKTKLL